MVMHLFLPPVHGQGPPFFDPSYVFVCQYHFQAQGSVVERLAKRKVLLLLREYKQISPNHVSPFRRSL